MLVKKTKSGKFSLELDLVGRESLLIALINFLEDESVAILFKQIKNETDAMRHLYYCVLAELALKHRYFISPAGRQKILLTRSQAIAIMWLLRHYDNNFFLLELKSNLHQLL
jgi:hypothetical protein